MTEQEARDCEHEYEVSPHGPNLYRCPKGCDWYVRSLDGLEYVRTMEKARRERKRINGELGTLAWDEATFTESKTARLARA